MRYLVLLLSLIFAPVLFAQGTDSIHDLRAEALRLMIEGNHAEAYSAQRDAALIALSQGRPQLQAQCLIELAGYEFSYEEPAKARKRKILKHARDLAIKTGRLDLEARVVFPLYFAGDSEILHRQRLDYALMVGSFGSAEWTLSDLRKMEGTEELRSDTLKVADLMAEARLTAKGQTGRDAATTLVTAAQEIGKLGFELCYLSLLEEALEIEESLIAVMLPLYEKRGDIRGIILAKIINAPANPGNDKRDEVIATLEQAFAAAGELRRTDLQIRAASKLAKITGDSYWNEAIRLIEQSELFELIAAGRRAVRDPYQSSLNLTERLREHKDNAEAARLLVLLTENRQSAESVEVFRKTFREAIAADANSMRWAITMAEIAKRTEVFEDVVNALKPEVGNPFEYSGALEVLSTEDDRATLVKLLSHKDPLVAEAAAAALFRLGVEGFEADIRAELQRLSESNPPHLLYLHGALARLGDKSSLDALLEAAKRDEPWSEEEPKDGIVANGVLASLGFGSPMDSTILYIANHGKSPLLLRALGRMPNTWGQTETTMWNNGAGNYQAARVWGLRRVPVRAKYTNKKDPFALIWSFPNEHEGPYWDDFEFNTEVPAIEDKETRKMIDWAADNSGVHSNSLNAPAEEEGAEESVLDRLRRIERETRAARHGENERRLILIDWHSGSQYATCSIRAKTGAAVMENATQLDIPFKWQWKRHCVSGGILGALYRDVILNIAETDLLHKVEIILPGYEPITASVQGGEDGWSNIRAELPMILGEGLGDDRPIPLETILQGKLRVTFNFNGNYGEVEFLIRADVPPDAEKPDLVPLALTLDPAVPEIGEAARIFVRVKNQGKSVERNAIATVRFQVHNPQSEEGWHTLDAQVFVANGWRAGEVRTFEVRPKFVEGYYMNRFSYTYTPALGDSKLVAVVDPDNSIEEMDEENNQIELEVPLRRSREDGLKLAETEVIAALAEPIEKFNMATTVPELDAAYDEILGLMDRLQERPPAVREICRTLSEIYWFRRAKLRADNALKDLEEARATDTLTTEKARRIRSDLMRSQREMMNAGTPIKIEALEKARNATLLAAGVSSSVGDMDTLLYGADESLAGDASGTLKAMDAAMLVYIEAQRARQEGRVDAGNVMDAISNTADVIDVKLPGFSNFQREILKAELEYAEKGLRKEADAINALTEVIEGKEGAEERLMAAVGDVETHLKDGPFNEESLKNIGKGWVKDWPLVGPLMDVIFSWK